MVRLGPVTRAKTNTRATERGDLARFAAAVTEGLAVRTLAERFGLHYTTAAALRRRVLNASEEGRA